MGQEQGREQEGNRTEEDRNRKGTGSRIIEDVQIASPRTTQRNDDGTSAYSVSENEWKVK